MDYLLSASTSLVIIPVTFLFLCYKLPSTTMASAAALKQRMINFVRQGELMTRLRRKLNKNEPCHNFDYALGLSHEHIEMDKVLDISTKSLTYRYSLPSNQKLTPGFASALMDDLTAKLMGIDGASAGASLYFQTQLFPQKMKGDEVYVDIVNKTTKKGRTIAHTSTEFLSSDQELIGVSSHVKYLPTGSLFLDLMVQYYPPWFSPSISKLADKLMPPPRNEAVLLEKGSAKEILDSTFQYLSNGEAEFSMLDEHNNPFGSLHGGCTAMIMEKAAEPFAKELLVKDGDDNHDVHLETIQVHFLAAGRGRPTLKLKCETVDFVENSHALVKVRVLKPPKPVKSKKEGAKSKEASVLAEGTLKFVVV